MNALQNGTKWDSHAERQEACLHSWCLEEEVVLANKISLPKVRYWKTRHSELLDLMFGYRNVRELHRAEEVQILLPLAPPNCRIPLCSSEFTSSERLPVLMEITRNLKWRVRRLEHGVVVMTDEIRMKGEWHWCLYDKHWWVKIWALLYPRKLQLYLGEEEKKAWNLPVKLHFSYLCLLFHWCLLRFSFSMCFLLSLDRLDNVVELTY